MARPYRSQVRPSTAAVLAMVFLLDIAVITGYHQKVVGIVPIIKGSTERLIDNLKMLNSILHRTTMATAITRPMFKEAEIMSPGNFSDLLSCLMKGEDRYILVPQIIMPALSSKARTDRLTSSQIVSVHQPQTG